MIQHSSPPLASPIFLSHKAFQNREARTKHSLALQAGSSEAVAVVKSRIVVHEPPHTPQSIFSDLFISQSLALPISRTKNSKGGVFTAKPLAKLFRRDALYAPITIQVHYLAIPNINAGVLGHHSQVAVNNAANSRPHAMDEKSIYGLHSPVHELSFDREIFNRITCNTSIPHHNISPAKGVF